MVKELLTAIALVIIQLFNIMHVRDAQETQKQYVKRTKAKLRKEINDAMHKDDDGRESEQSITQ